jgi:hypothetical protein
MMIFSNPFGVSSPKLASFETRYPLWKPRGEQGLSGFLSLPVTLDEAKMLPLPPLLDSYSTQGRLPTDPLPAHFEVDPVNEQISKLFGDGPVQLPDQLDPEMREAARVLSQLGTSDN